MNIRNYFKTTIILVVLTLACIELTRAQTANFPAPREEKLLNGLKLLIWNEPASPKVTVKLRVHNGAAFDPKDKMGVMALLSDILFPSPEAKAFFTEDLEGSLDVASNYDYIQITATGKPEEIQAILETLATAVTNPQITNENFDAVRNARLEKVKELEKNPVYVADQAVAKKLFGDFPYGRSAEGTAASLAKIDKADLMFARDRFFTADNATLAVTGKVQPDFVYRATRRLFGAWKKSESKIPATFRLPEPPDTKELSIEMADIEKYPSRSAMNVAARNDKDFYPTQILTKIWETQFCYTDESKFGKAKYEPYLLRGVFVVSRNASFSNEATPPPAGTRNPCLFLARKNGTNVYPPITQSDFDQAKNRLISAFLQKTKSASDLAELWLDVDTFKLVSVKDEMSKLINVNLADVQRVAGNLQKQPIVSVSVKKAGAAKP
jgi:zinc protease